MQSRLCLIFLFKILKAKQIKNTFLAAILTFKFKKKNIYAMIQNSIKFFD